MKSQKPYENVMLRTPSDIDAFAKSIGWFSNKPSDYTGEGKLVSRKLPSEKSSKYTIGTTMTGMDGNLWKVTKTSNGISRWVPVKLNKLFKNLSKN